MPQNVQRGMVRDDERLLCRQIVGMLANRRIGPLNAAAIAANLGVSPRRIYGALDTLIRTGRLVRTSPDVYTAPPVVDGEPLRPHAYLAPAATPHSVPEALRGDWLLVEGTGNAEDAELRGGRGGERQRFTTEETEGTEERAEGEGEERGTAEDAEGGEGRENAEDAEFRGEREEERAEGTTAEVAEDVEATGAADGRAT